MGPVIFDTSVWIAFFRKEDCAEVQLLKEYLATSDQIYMCPTIVEEILQGIKTDQQFAQIRGLLSAFQLMNFGQYEMAIKAAELYRSLRKKGITIRKSNDCLIGAYAKKANIPVVHLDRDFDLMFSN